MVIVAFGHSDQDQITGKGAVCFVVEYGPGPPSLSNKFFPLFVLFWFSRVLVFMFFSRGIRFDFCILSKSGNFQIPMGQDGNFPTRKDP